MAAFTAQDVKTLREKTGCGMMDCKKALTNADGDMDKAIDFLREQGLAKQLKRQAELLLKVLLMQQLMQTLLLA